MSYKDLINRSMPGRNGFDELFNFNLIIIIILAIMDIFINNIYLSLAFVLSIAILIFRIVSKNVKQRKKENAIYVKIINYPIKKFKLYRDIIKNYNKALYKRCPKCHQVLKLPLKKGTHTVKCPECGNSFTVKCNRNEVIKAEIIK